MFLFSRFNNCSDKDDELSIVHGTRHARDLWWPLDRWDNSSSLNLRHSSGAWLFAIEIYDSARREEITKSQSFFNEISLKFATHVNSTRRWIISKFSISKCESNIYFFDHRCESDDALVFRSENSQKGRCRYFDVKDL